MYLLRTSTTSRSSSTPNREAMTRTALRNATDAGVPLARRLGSVCVGSILAALIVGLLYLFWPSSLGGCSTLTIVSGQSMEPTYHTGDLVWSRCGEAAVGDIVVYSPPGHDNSHVIHRIVDGNGDDGWILQGDNNDFLDPWQPDDSYIVGIARVHIPGMGTILYSLGNPCIWISLVLVAAAIYLWPSDSDDGEEPEAIEEAVGAEPDAESAPDAASEPDPEHAAARM